MKPKRAAVVVGAVVITALAVGLLVVNNLAAKPSQPPPLARGVTHAPELWHCGMHPQVIKDHPGNCPICHMALTPLKSRSADGAQPDQSAGPTVSIDPTLVQNMGVRTAKVSRGPLTKTVRTVGIVSIAEPGLHDVSLKVGGWIDTIYADQDGMEIAEGAPLFNLYSPELQVAQQELIGALNAEKASASTANPALDKDARGMVDSARRKLRLWDIADQDIDAIVKSGKVARALPIRSPVTGHIEEKTIVQGSAVQPGVKLLRVADHTNVWLEAQVYAAQMPLVKVGQHIVATVDGMPGRTFNGTISFLHPRVDAVSRSLMVRMTLDNPGFQLKPGMFATAQIATQSIPDAICVPREAVIDTGKRQIAFAVDAEGRFTPRRVTIGVVGDDDQVQVLSGLSPGESVMTSGQFLMDVESRTIEAMQKLAAGPAAGEAATSPSAPSMPATLAQDDPKKADSLVVVSCSMTKARWVQRGETISNPYMGKKMSDCGEVEQKVPDPAKDSPLSATLDAYAMLAASLAADKTDQEAATALKIEARKLPANDAKALKEAAEALSAAKDIKDARAAFKTVSEQLIRMLGT